MTHSDASPHEAPQPDPRRTPTSNPILRRVLTWGAVLAAAIAVVGGFIGYLSAGGSGLISALIGTVIAVAFMGITAVSILVANRFSASDLFVGAFFGIVLGGWILKFVLFLVLILLLQDQPWLQPIVFLFSVIAGVLGSLVVDMVVVMRSRLPYVSDATPHRPSIEP